MSQNSWNIINKLIMPPANLTHSADAWGNSLKPRYPLRLLSLSHSLSLSLLGCCLPLYLRFRVYLSVATVFCSFFFEQSCLQAVSLSLFLASFLSLSLSLSLHLVAAAMNCKHSKLRPSCCWRNNKRGLFLDFWPITAATFNSGLCSLALSLSHSCTYTHTHSQTHFPLFLFLSKLFNEAQLLSLSVVATASVNSFLRQPRLTLQRPVSMFPLLWHRNASKSEA